MKTSAASSSSPPFANRAGLVTPLAGLTLAALLAVSAGGCMISAEADVPDVEVTQHGIAFAGIPASVVAASGGTVSTDMTFTQKRPNLDLPTGVESSVKAVQVDLIAQTGVSDLDFLHSLRVTMTPIDGSADPVVLVDYQKAPGTTVGSTLAITSANPVNILDQWKADSALFDVQLSGALPPQAWTIDMDVHFSGKASYKF